MNKLPSNITFVLFSFNEEHRIEYIVRNLVPYGEVFLLDGGSTDKTKEIAEKFGARFFTRPDTTSLGVETPANLDFARSLAKTDWIFWSYVDNFLPKTLLDKLTAISHQDKFKYVHVPVFTYMWGDTTHPLIKASYTCFFRKDLVDFSGNRIHGMGKFLGNKNEVLHLPVKDEFAMRHFSLYDLNKYVTSHLRYANVEAEDKRAHGQKFSVKYLLGSMTHYFYLFYKRGWRAGVRGLFVALLYSFFRLMVAVRLYELKHHWDLESIEAEFRKEKQKIVDEVEKGHANV